MCYVIYGGILPHSLIPLYKAPRPYSPRPYDVIPTERNERRDLPMTAGAEVP